MAVRNHASLLPRLNSFFLLPVKEGDDAFLVEHIGFLANEGILHFVESLLEVLLELADEQLADVRQLALALRYRVDLNAFNEHLDQGSALRELCPCQRKAAQRNREVMLGRPSDHHL